MRTFLELEEQNVENEKSRRGERGFPKIGGWGIGGDLECGNDLADRLLHALAASGKVINGRAVQVIEHAPQVRAAEPPVEEAPDHGKPFAMDNKSRFRRY